MSSGCQSKIRFSEPIPETPGFALTSILLLPLGLMFVDTLWTRILQGEPLLGIRGGGQSPLDPLPVGGGLRCPQSGDFGGLFGQLIAS